MHIAQIVIQSENGAFILAEVFFVFQLFRECNYWWTTGSRRHMSPRSTIDSKVFFFRTSIFFVLTSIKIVIMWEYYTIPFGFNLLLYYLFITFQLLQLLYFVLLRATAKD